MGEESCNLKSHAWDMMGTKFYFNGVEKIKPNNATIDQYLAGVEANDKVCIVGASTVGLIKAAIQKGANVTVIDFSQGMCSDLERVLPPLSCQMVKADITQKGEMSDLKPFDYVLTDRLVNRFTVDEAQRFLDVVEQILDVGGELRTVVRLGIYELDKKLIQYQNDHPDEPVIYDAIQNTIDFTNAEKALWEIGPQNGTIPQEVLIQWYIKRGMEKRYETFDVKELFKRKPLEMVSCEDTPDCTPSKFYSFIKK